MSIKSVEREDKISIFWLGTQFTIENSEMWLKFKKIKIQNKIEATSSNPSKRKMFYDE